MKDRFSPKLERIRESFARHHNAIGYYRGPRKDVMTEPETAHDTQLRVDIMQVRAHLDQVVHRLELVRRRLADNPKLADEYEGLISNALDGVGSAVGYMRTFAQRIGGGE